MKYKISSFCLSILMTFMIVLSAQAQNSQTFSGVVVDEKNEPVIGASIKVVGTGTGTITDLDGKFTLSVPAKGKVEISYLGYSSQVVSDLSQKEIVLKEDALMLEETVVVGYGVQKKSHLTGAISTVALDDVKDLAATDLGSSLRGLVSGVSISGGEGRPGEKSRIVIRGSDVSSSFSRSDANASPLYVIDGFISTETEFNNLEPTMVENISILKDGAAAVYGVRAGNGAVIVTTKRGVVGKPKVSYSGQFGVADAVSTPKMLSAYDYGKIWNGARAATFDQQQDATIMRDLFQADELEMMKGLNYDLLDQEWKAAFTQKHSVNINGGTENATYFAGIAYNSQDGNLGKIKYDRWNYRAGVDVKLNKWLKTSLQISGDYGENRKAYNKVGGSSPDLDYNTLLTRPRYIPDYIGGRPIAAYGPTNSEKPVHGSQDYHYGVVQNSDNHTETMNQNMFINSAIEYDLGWNEITKGLKLKFTYSKSISTNKSNEKGTKYVLSRMIDRTGSGKHLYTGGTEIQNEDSNFGIVNIDNGNQLVRRFDRSDRYQMSFMATYQRTFGDHDVSGLFGIEKSESELEDSEAAKADPYSFTNGQSNGAFGDPNGIFSRTESGNLSYIGRVNYAYMNKYLVEFLIRSDASTKFAPSNYWGVFPSLSLGWTMSEEKWFRESLKGINHMKLRGSIGLMGRDNIAAWQWRRHYSLQADKGPIFGGIDSNSGSTIGIPNDDINPNAHWDKSYKMNVGVDFAVLQNRLSATLEGYVFWDRDVFAQRSGSQVPSTVGARATDENYGKVNIYGGELSINWRDKIGKDFKYSIGVNTDYQDNKVLKMHWPDMIEIDGLHPGGRKDTGTWGLEAMGMFRSYQDIEEYFDRYNITNYLGLSKSQVYPGMLIYKDVRGKQNPDGSWNAPDGVVDLKDDKVKISNRSNPYGLAVNLKAEYKALSFSAQISANWGGYGFVPTYARSAGHSRTSGVSARDALSFINMPSFWANDMFVYEEVRDENGNVLVEQNLNAQYPNLSYDINKHASTFWKVSSARVALRNLTIAYALPKQLINKVGIESCRLNFTGQNLLSFYNPYPDNFMDPMSGEYGSYPTLRRFTLGLNVSF